MMTAYCLDPNHSCDWLTQTAFKRIRELALTLLFDVTKAKDAKDSFIKEFSSYLRDPNPKKVFINEVYSAWDKSASYPYLRLVGKRLAACHGSSANTERIFSALGRIMTASRNRMSLEAAFDMINIQMSSTKDKLRKDFKNYSAIETLTENELENENLGGFQVEACILDENIEAPYEDDFHYGSIETTPGYELFAEWIDFDKVVMPVPGPSSQHRVRTSAEMAKENSLD